MTLRRISLVFLVAALIFSISPVHAGTLMTPSGVISPVDKARQMLSMMSPEERVGQLFLVTFNGTNVQPDSQIHDLIRRFHIGGVVLLAANDNFTAAPETIANAYQLISQIQTVKWEASHPSESGLESGTPTPIPSPTNAPSNYIPLFIGISQDGDGYPNDQILNGLTPLPDLMALGATWNTSLAEQTGAVAGKELSSLGFNLFIGPSLDVLESPGSTLGSGLGANAFGGDPYWVGAMGSAYISGLHNGGNGQLMVVADHFPGRGSADRPAGAEAATVRKSLEQLKQIELAPFFTVTGNATSPAGTADGLLVSHIRYQGFQGNIRSTTRPVSFDAQALSAILSLPAFATWRAAGGLMVSDDLGSPTVRSFYDPAGQTYLARLVARDAFLAGNDLLFMGNIVSSDAPDNFTTVVRALEFFNQKYREDTAFALRVDDSVSRILTAKYRSYGNFETAQVTPPISDLATSGQAQSVTFDVARESSTLVSPTLGELDTVLPTVPVAWHRMVFLTDTSRGSQCSTCTEQSMLEVDALQKVILNLYGPQAGGQVLATHLISYPLTNLESILDGGVGDVDLENSLRQTDWLVINMLDAEAGEPRTTMLSRFLSERQDLLQDKRVIVFAFNAPYYLDATNISKLTAYYCLYSKSAPFVEVAARLLFREVSPLGSLPVSVVGIGYDLLTATSPDPNQVIGLSLEAAAVPVETPSVTLELIPTPSFYVGDTISVRTGIIVDHNGHPVPDGTGVRFSIALSGEGGVIQQIDALTTQGSAGTSFSIDRPGLLEISAESDPAITSIILQLDASGEGFGVTVVAPTPAANLTPQPEITVIPDEGTRSPISKGRPGILGWFVTMVILAVLGYLVNRVSQQVSNDRWVKRWTLSVMLGGLVAYTCLASHLPGITNYLKKTGWIGLVGIVVLGSTAGLGAGVLWKWLSRGSTKRQN